MAREIRLRHWFGSTGVLAVTTALAAGVCILTVSRTASTSREADHEAALAASDRLSTALTRVTSSVSGADGIAVDGMVSEQEFLAFGMGVVETSGLAAIAYAEPVTDEERGAWEAATGLTMIDTDGNGGFSPSVSRPLHVPVRFVAPSNERSRAVLGFDVMSDLGRASGVEQIIGGEGDTRLVGPISLATNAIVGLFVVSAVRNGDGTVVGYLSSGFSLDGPVEELQAIPGLGRITLSIDGQQVAGEERGDAATSFQLLGREFTVTASDVRKSNWLLPASLAFSTLLLGVATAMAARRDRRRALREARETSRARLQTELAEQLVTATSTTSVMKIVVERASAIVGAAHTNVGRRVQQQARLQVIHDSALAGDLADRFALQELSDDLPLAEVARTGVPVMLPNRRALAERFPKALPDVVSLGMHALYCAPLGLGSDGTVGAIGFAFEDELDTDDQRDVEAAASLVSQVAGRAFERALVRELVQARVQQLSEFARALTTSRSSLDVATCIAQRIPGLLDCEAAELAAAPDPGVDGSRLYPLPGQVQDTLVLRHRQDRRWSEIDETVTITVVDLIGGALTRTRLYDQEHAVLVRLQSTLLSAPPEVAAFDIAVGYRSALETVGMGGDWYSVIDTEQALHLVIGDVAGHGPNAVALMAEVKTVLRHLLSNDTPIEAALQFAHETLQRRNDYASAAIVRIDKCTHVLTYVNAGHLPLLRFSSSGVVPLDVMHRPWLGVATSQPGQPTASVFLHGDLLLMFTDGLVEERHEPVDTGVGRLHSLVKDRPAQAIVDELIESRMRQRTPSSVDDDIAVVAVIRRACPGG